MGREVHSLCGNTLICMYVTHILSVALYVGMMGRDVHSLCGTTLICMYVTHILSVALYVGMYGERSTLIMWHHTHMYVCHTYTISGTICRDVWGEKYTHYVAPHSYVCMSHIYYQWHYM